MTKVGRAVEKGETDGFMKCWPMPRRRRYSRDNPGTGGDEAIHCISQQCMPASRIAHAALGTHSSDSRELIPTVFVK